MSSLCSVCHIFTTQTRIVASIQLLVNEKFIHQCSFKLIKTFFISPASIYATLFIKVGGKVRGKKSQTHAGCRYCNGGPIWARANRNNITITTLSYHQNLHVHFKHRFTVENRMKNSNIINPFGLFVHRIKISMDICD